MKYLDNTCPLAKSKSIMKPPPLAAQRTPIKLAGRPGDGWISRIPILALRPKKAKHYKFNA
ncbi:hypothetical protein [Uliginosibacterium gangwonense]|uniref:hypothetical protein n=1 Tax=Uliginosibacterium gangwonense TaxID=392736 RepID=UPI00036E9BAF|nr:hypothetical protein [Uliginosibacterium gangwonense]